MTTNAIITARYDSKRLPGKALIPINGKNTIQRMVDALRTSNHIDKVIVATSGQEIAQYCEDNDILYFVGDEEDCITRLYECTKAFPSDAVIRLWGDCPLLNINLVKAAFKQKHPYHILSVSGYPSGWGFYVFVTSWFRNIYESMTTSERHHWNNVEEISCWGVHGYNTHTLTSPVDLSHINYSLDTQGDLERIEAICKSYE